MPRNYSEYQKNYMRNYIKNSDNVFCEVCNNGVTYKTYRKYRHIGTKSHKAALENIRNEIPKFLLEVKQNYLNILKTYPNMESAKLMSDKLNILNL